MPSSAHETSDPYEVWESVDGSKPKMRIVKYLDTHPGYHTASDIFNELGMQSTNTYTHLSELVDDGILVSEKNDDGTKEYLFCSDRSEPHTLNGVIKDRMELFIVSEIIGMIGIVTFIIGFISGISILNNIGFVFLVASTLMFGIFGLMAYYYAKIRTE